MYVLFTKTELHRQAITIIQCIIVFWTSDVGGFKYQSRLIVAL